MGERYRTLVPACDADGNGVGGIRLPELEAPLGTYQGWNPRGEAYGASDYMTRFDGSFWIFPVTEAEREKTGDPRRSVAARYKDRESYVRAVTESVQLLVADRILLAKDGDAYVDLAKHMAWPPEPVNDFPFWKLDPDPATQRSNVGR